MLRASLALAALAAFVLLVAPTASAQARSFEVTESGGSRVQFTSDAPLERMTGTSSAVSGSFEVDPAALTGAHGSVAVRVASIRTGIDLRDEHLRSETWLDATRFPNATFELERVTGATALTQGTEARVTLHGRFTVHGRTRAVSATARVTWSGNSIRVRARFRIRLTEHGVSIPSIVELKVSDEITVDVNLVATARP